MGEIDLWSAGFFFKLLKNWGLNKECGQQIIFYFLNMYHKAVSLNIEWSKICHLLKGFLAVCSKGDDTMWKQQWREVMEVQRDNIQCFLLSQNTSWVNTQSRRGSSRPNQQETLQRGAASSTWCLPTPAGGSPSATFFSPLFPLNLYYSLQWSHYWYLQPIT